MGDLGQIGHGHHGRAAAVGFAQAHVVQRPPAGAADDVIHFNLEVARGQHFDLEPGFVALARTSGAHLVQFGLQLGQLILSGALFLIQSAQITAQAGIFFLEEAHQLGLLLDRLPAAGQPPGVLRCGLAQPVEVVDGGLDDRLTVIESL